MDVASSRDLAGLWVPIVTPFDERGGVNLRSLDRLARRLLDDGATGLVALGTTGEPATLSPSERDDVMRMCAAACGDHGGKLIVGVGTNCTASTIDAALHAHDVASPMALLVVVPYYSRPSEAAAADHIRAVADAAETPVVAYNVPYRTGLGLGATHLLELAEHPRVIGLKQSVGALDHDTLEVLRRRPPDFAVLAGDDAYIAPTLLLGGTGTIAAAAHACTATFAEMVRAATEGDFTTAASLSHALLPVVDAGFAEPNPAVWKAILHAQGEISTATVRRPLTEASAPAVRAALAAIASCRIGLASPGVTTRS